ncbi:hypothetical protein GCM10009827_064140 [Dactylosporangium maewongense]|uniref:Uncharacterized protein n=1 Tax=Dactylosporangium maewongense TaxID=634393 RepID=A0ABN2BAY3_9ACTN
MTVTSATLKMSPESYGVLPCIQWDQTVRLDFTIQVSSTARSEVKFDVESSAGLVRSGTYYGTPTQDGVATGSESTVVKVGPGRPETVTFWLRVTKPTSKESNRVTFHNYCA